MSISGVERSVDHNGYRFSSRQDYIHYFEARGFTDVVNNDDLVAQIQRNWHTRGQNGCVFAQAVASHADEAKWESYVVRDFQPEAIEERIQSAIADPENQILSLLFPAVTSEEQLREVVANMVSLPSVRVAFETNYGERTTVALRIPVDAEGTESWLMGFGDFSFLPNTRQAPFTEIAIRTKVKPDEIFHRLNQDRQAAHLADTQIGLSDKQSEVLWTATLARTRGILGEEPNHFSAAKVTFTLPTAN